MPAIRRLLVPALLLAALALPAHAQNLAATGSDLLPVQASPGAPQTANPPSPSPPGATPQQSSPATTPNAPAPTKAISPQTIRPQIPIVRFILLGLAEELFTTSPSSILPA